MALIRFYQATLALLLGGRCRFLPSCSEYARIAIEKYGATRGAWLGVKRVCRCHPFSSSNHGVDWP